MHAFAANLVQLGMLGLGVSLLLVSINYLKADHGRTAAIKESEDDAAETSAATRGRIAP